MLTFVSSAGNNQQQHWWEKEAKKKKKHTWNFRLSQSNTMWSQLRSTGGASNHVFGIVGHSTLCKNLSEEHQGWWDKEHGQREDDFHNTSCICMVFVLQYLSTSHLQRKHTSILWLRCAGKLQKKIKSYSRIQLMLKAPITKINIGDVKEVRTEVLIFPPVLIPWEKKRSHRRTCTWWPQEGKLKKEQLSYICTVLRCWVRKMTEWRYTVKKLQGSMIFVF